MWRLYTESFPEWERRRISSHSRASEDNHFHTYIALDNGNLWGLVFYRKHDKTIYVEHLAVNALLRGKNIGSQILRRLIDKNPDCRIILEIDPLVDEISKRRLKFYQRLGFMLNDYEYVHPSYSKTGKPHELRIMSYPGLISPEELEAFRREYDPQNNEIYRLTHSDDEKEAS